MNTRPCPIGALCYRHRRVGPERVPDETCKMIGVDPRSDRRRPSEQPPWRTSALELRQLVKQTNRVARSWRLHWSRQQRQSYTV